MARDAGPAARTTDRRFVRRFAAAARPVLPRGASVLVACSGGADSVALLLLVLEARRLLGLRGVAVAHLDHALREDSAADAAFVAALAARLGVPAEIERRPVRRARGESLEDAARRVRYRFLGEAARRTGSGVVATAHHMDDQAETVLYRAVRGAGLSGLRGILPRARIEGTSVARPLLPFRRESLRAFLRSRGEAWREDPTNEGPDTNDRVRLRTAVLPAIRRALRRDPVPPLARLAAIAERRFARGPGTKAEPRRPGPPEPEPPTPDGGLVCDVRPVGTAVFLERLRARPGTMEIVDADAVSGAVRVRAPRPGDRFRALGMSAEQRLAHYLQRRGVPVAARAAVRVACDDEGIVAVAGLGIAARVAVHDATERVLVLRWGAGPEGPDTK